MSWNTWLGRKIIDRIPKKIHKSFPPNLIFFPSSELKHTIRNKDHEQDGKKNGRVSSISFFFHPLSWKTWLGTKIMNRMLKKNCKSFPPILFFFPSSELKYTIRNKDHEQDTKKEMQEFPPYPICFPIQWVEIHD